MKKIKIISMFKSNYFNTAFHLAIKKNLLFKGSIKSSAKKSANLL